MRSPNGRAAGWPSSRPRSSPSTTDPTAGSSTWTSPSSRARSTASWDPTAPARRRRSACCSTSSVRRRGARSSSASRRRSIPVAIHRRVGYLPGEFALFDRLTGGQTIEYFANLRGGVDPLYQADLVARFDLDPSRRYKEYSKGNKQKVGLVIALQHRPDLLVLDEPTVRPRPARPADVLRAPPRDGRGGPHRLPLVAHPRRGREDVRPGRDHPRRPPRRRRPRRGAPRPGPPRGRAPVRGPRPRVGVLRRSRA